MNNIKALRKEKRLTVDGLAKEMGVSKSTISLWENGKTNPRINQIKKLADFFEVNESYVLGYSDNKKGMDLRAQYRKLADNDFIPTIDQDEAYQTYNALSGAVDLLENANKLREELLKKTSESSENQTNRDKFIGLLSQLDDVISKTEQDINDLTINDRILDEQEKNYHSVHLSLIPYTLSDDKTKQLINSANSLSKLQELEEKLQERSNTTD